MDRLIYFPKNKLLPKGGPAGYLHSLREGLTLIHKDLEIDFLPEVRSLEDSAWLRNKVPAFIKDYRRLRNQLSLLSGKAVPPVDIDRYDVVHFHEPLDMYLLRESLETYKGKVVLTSHSPCAYYLDLTSRLNPKMASKHKASLAELQAIDLYAFERADTVVFPCPQAEEPYGNTWDSFRKIRPSMNVKYLPTGTRQCIAQVSKREIRRRYGIPENAFVVSYAGRHNEIKGYGDLRSLGSLVLENEDTWFLVAGKEEPLKGLDHPRWVEIGWTDDPHSVIAASDVFVLPNRETYFDLVLLEALSLGSLVIASNTGGNKHFSRFAEIGVRLYSDEAEFFKLLEWSRNLDPLVKDRLSKANKVLFEKCFSLKVFAKRYLEVIDEITEGR